MYCSRTPSVSGRLELVFAPRGSGTALVHAYARAPLKIVRPFPLDAGRQLVQILTLGPGICAGDAYSIDVTVESGARAVVVTQSASRLHGMPDAGRAEQRVTLTVLPGAHLEYYPGITIPFPGSDFSQDLHVAVAAGARFGLLECWAMGRIGRGEYLRFRRISTRTSVLVDGLPAYADTLELSPGEIDLEGWGLLEGHRYIASGYWYGGGITAAPARSRTPGVLSAFGETAPGHIYLRALASDGPALEHEVRRSIAQVYRCWQLEAIPFPRFAS
jgi:urease accessory protein